MVYCQHKIYDNYYCTYQLFFSGAVLFNIHALDLKDEIQNLLYDLVKENMVLWKQMRSLELAAALVAETLMEMGVKFFTNPEEIHWPKGNVTKPSSPASKKKTGKTKQKNKHGVYGQLVADLAPQIPKGQPAKDVACTQKESKGNAPARGKTKKTKDHWWTGHCSRTWRATCSTTQL